MQDIEIYQWGLIIVSSLLFFFLAPFSKKPSEFFSALSVKGKQPNIIMLTSSLVISWIFAKSITNAANLGLEYGMVGGIAYATYYLSFIVAGIIIYKLRTKGNFNSIHHFLRSKFGSNAVLIFSVLIAIRLFNEVWSNTMVIGSYFGEMGSQPYYLAIIVFTALTLAYTLKGGLRSSLLTDAIQMVFFGILLFVLLKLVMTDESQNISSYVRTGEWNFAGGLGLLLVAFIQIFSYPFHDSVMTDRGFISPPKQTLRSFIAAAIIGFVCITLFSLIGIFAQFKGLKGQAAVEVGKYLGVGSMLMLNFIMVTSAASTLDSAFSSFSKLSIIDLKLQKLPTVKMGRIVMVILAVLGTIPIFLNPTILSATTISGTMVLGLAPIFLLWNLKASKLSFYLAIFSGILVGLIHAFDALPKIMILTEGPYANLLSANIWGSILCFVGYIIPILVSNNKSKQAESIKTIS